jgi:hypothetical protein
MQFSFNEIELMLEENRQEARDANRQEAKDATPSTLAGLKALTRTELMELLAAHELKDPFGDILLDDAQEEARLKRAAEREEQRRIQRAWEEKCESIAVRKTRLRVNDSDWAKYRDQLSRRQQQRGRDDGYGQRNRAKQPALWSPFEDTPKVPRAVRKAKAREAAVEERLAAPPNPFD